MTTPPPNHRWYHLTPDRFFIGLLVVQVFLLLSEMFQWFDFNEKKGWTVVIAVGVVGLAVVVMLIWALGCLCLRRRFQFDVRSLLVFLLAVSMPLGWFAWEMQKARRQREAVEAIEEAGASVAYDQLTSPWLWWLVGHDFFCEVVRVDCRFSALGDDDARHLQELKRLKWLNLSHTQISDDGLRYLNNLTHLESLFISETQTTDVGLGHLGRLPNLRSLYVDGTKVTDDGVSNLQQKLPNCEIDTLSLESAYEEVKRLVAELSQSSGLDGGESE